MFMYRFAITALAILMTGCAISPPTAQEAENADYGEYPSAYREIVKAHMEYRLKDPSSAIYNFLNTPKRDWYRLNTIYYGYGVCVAINAKNSYGGYTGNKVNYFLIKNDNIVMSRIPEDSFDQSIIGSFCQKLQ